MRAPLALPALLMLLVRSAPPAAGQLLAAPARHRQCSPYPCVSTDYRSYARCLRHQCGPVCPQQTCRYASCGGCQYNQQGPCCQSCCQPPPPPPCSYTPIWPYLRCGNPCQSGWCGGGGWDSGSGSWPGYGYGYGYPAGGSAPLQLPAPSAGVGVGASPCAAAGGAPGCLG